MVKSGVGSSSLSGSYDSQRRQELTAKSAGSEATVAAAALDGGVSPALTHAFVRNNDDSGTSGARGMMMKGREGRRCFVFLFVFRIGSTPQSTTTEVLPVRTIVQLSILFEEAIDMLWGALWRGRNL